MGKSALKRPAVTAPREEKERAKNRKKHLTRKLRQGKTLSIEEQNELAAYGAGGTRPPAQEQQQLDMPLAAPQDGHAPSGEAGDEAVPQAAGSPPPPPPRAFEPPEPPPTVEIVSGDWRKRYRQKTGREGACVEMATLYCAMLTRASNWIAEQGQRPIFGTEEIQRVIFPAAVLTADKLLPAHFEMSPEVEVCATSGALLGQALLVRWRKGNPKAPERPAPLRSVPAPGESNVSPASPPRPVETPVKQPAVASPIPTGAFIPKPTDVF